MKSYRILIYFRELKHTSSFLNEYTFCFSFQLSDGQEREEIGEIQKTATSSILRVKGSYTFKGTDSVIYKVVYTADENGFNSKITENSSSENDDLEFDVDNRISPTLVKTLVGG